MWSTIVTVSGIYELRLLYWKMICMENTVDEVPLILPHKVQYKEVKYTVSLNRDTTECGPHLRHKSCITAYPEAASLPVPVSATSNALLV